MGRQQVDYLITENRICKEKLGDGKVGQEIAITLFRKDRLRKAKLRLVRNPERKWIFAVDGEASARVKRLREKWLGIAA